MLFKKPKKKIVRPKREGIIVKRYCRFCKDKIGDIDYKDVSLLEKVVSDRGRILSTRFSHGCVKHQRKLSAAVKRARFLSLIPYTK